MAGKLKTVHAATRISRAVDSKFANSQGSPSGADIGKALLSAGFQLPDAKDAAKSVRDPCKYHLTCYRKNEQHKAQYAHPGDADYLAACRKCQLVPNFTTLHDAFEYCDEGDCDMISDRELFNFIATELLADGSKGAAWEKLDQDGNGCVNFPEFVEWAQQADLKPRYRNMPLGLQDEGPLECRFLNCRCKCFDPDPSNPGCCRCGHKKGVHAAPASKAAVPYPPYWRVFRGGPPKGDMVAPDYFMRYELSPQVGSNIAPLQEIIDRSYRDVYTRDRGPPGTPVPKGFRLVKAEQIENATDWRMYWLKRHKLEATCEANPRFVARKALTETGTLRKHHQLHEQCNEWLLFHGTSKAACNAIAKSDFTMSLAGTTTGTLYGRGSYFADSFTKADEYAKEEDGVFRVMVCRIAGGNALYTDAVDPDANHLEQSCLAGEYDSIIGDREKCRGTYKEYVIFDSDQVFVEYIFHYVRIF